MCSTSDSAVSTITCAVGTARMHGGRAGDAVGARACAGPSAPRRDAPPLPCRPASAPSAAAPTTSRSSCPCEEIAQTLPQHGMVVDEQHADHALGTPSVRRVPVAVAPTRPRGRRRRAAARSLSSASPRWPFGPFASTSSAGKPRPSSSTASSTRSPSVDDADVGRAARRRDGRRCGSPRAPSRTAAARWRARAAGRATPRASTHALRLQRRQEVAQGRLEADGVKVRRVDVDQQRLASGARRAGPRRQRDRGSRTTRPTPRAVARSAAAARLNERPARSWTTPSWRSEAIRRRSASDASMARISKLLAFLLAAGAGGGRGRAPAAAGSATAAPGRRTRRGRTSTRPRAPRTLTDE